MARFKLAIGIHNHQPVGNFQAVFEEAHQKAYLPFLTLLREYPAIRLSLHQSGILWRWQRESHPEFFRLVGDLVDRGQVELMTGGFYEPILPAIPERDACGQIKKQTAYLRDHFDVDATGFWPPERVWEPHLPKVLAAAGVKFLPIDDTHFLYAGFEPDQLSGPFITEHEGASVKLLPIRHRLRYQIPFGKVDEIIADLRQAADRNPDDMVVYADDGEKFGIWPETSRHCYDNGWLVQFFDALVANSDWLEVVPLGEAAQLPPVGRAYLPAASYPEMLQWSLPPAAHIEFERLEAWLKDQDQWERFGRFVRGGFWRSFLVKYEEANLMHKKMLAVSAKLQEFDRSEPEHPEQADRARDRLYAGQCNCPYWHGVFGGLYLPHIRQAVYSNLIEADTILDQLLKRPTLLVEVRDYDTDGADDIVVATDTVTAVFKPSRGATLVHLGLKKHHFDPTDTMTRRREAYHLRSNRVDENAADRRTRSVHERLLARDPDLKGQLIEDWYLKRCFIDHFFTDDVDFDRFAAGKYGEEGDFIVEPYQYDGDTDGAISFSRKGHLWRASGVVRLDVRKRFHFRAGSENIGITYELSCPDGQDLKVNFGIENNFNFQAGHAEDRFILVDGRRHNNSYLDSPGRHYEARSYALIDQYRDLGLAVTSNRPGQVWHLPIRTVSLSENGFEEVYQGTTVVTVYHLALSVRPVTVTQTLFAGNTQTIGDSIAPRSGARS